MKTQYFFLILLSVIINGCQAEKHLEFQGIPINGNLYMFADKLVKLGFAEAESTEEQVKLKGEFLGKTSEINVYATQKSLTAYKVTVDMPVENRDSLESGFERIKRHCTSKHGSGTSRYQQYRNSDRFLFNEPKRIRRISVGDFTRHTTGSGIITIEVKAGYISITYLDNINNGIRDKEMDEGKSYRLN